MLKKRIIAFAIFFCFFLCSCSAENSQEDYSWVNNRTIVHALGVVDGETYTNSLEALNNSLQQGQTVFEVDLALTADGEMICAHDISSIAGDSNRTFLEGKELGNLTKDEFMGLKIRDKYTPICMEDIILVMKNNPRMYIVTDTKEDKEEGIKKQFLYIVELAKKNNCTEVLNRIVPQVYNDDMFYILKDIYGWKSYIYTSYYTQDTDWNEDIFIKSVHDKGIKVLAVFAGRGTDSLLQKANSLGLKVYVHTYNTEEERKAFFDRGFWGLYTDALPPIVSQ